MHRESKSNISLSTSTLLISMEMSELLIKERIAIALENSVSIDIDCSNKSETLVLDYKFDKFDHFKLESPPPPDLNIKDPWKRAQAELPKSNGKRKRSQNRWQ